MGLYLYCIVTAGTPPPSALLGLDDAPVEARAAGPLAFWVSPAPAPPQPTLGRIRSHNAVVEAALAGGATPLPARFGQWLAGDAELAAVRAERESAYVAGLARVAGAVEYGVRVLDPLGAHAPSEPPEPAPTGTAYLRRLAARDHAREALDARGREIAAELRAVLGNAVREERVEALPSPHGLVSVAHLVERARAGEYRAGLDDVRRREPALRFLVTGPWPPYSFGP